MLGVPVVQYVAALRKRSEHQDEAFALAPLGTQELRQLAGAFNDEFGKNQEQLHENRKLVDGLTELVEDVSRNAESLNEMSARLEANARGTSAIVQQVTTAMQGVAGGRRRPAARPRSRSGRSISSTRLSPASLRAPLTRKYQVQTATETATEMAAGVEEVAANAPARRRGQPADPGLRRARRREPSARPSSPSTPSPASFSEAAVRVEELGKLGERSGRWSRRSTTSPSRPTCWP